MSPTWAETMPRWYWIIGLAGKRAALSLRKASARWCRPRREGIQPRVSERRGGDPHQQRCLTASPVFTGCPPDAVKAMAAASAGPAVNTGRSEQQRPGVRRVAQAVATVVR